MGVQTTPMKLLEVIIGECAEAESTQQCKREKKAPRLFWILKPRPAIFAGDFNGEILSVSAQIWRVHSWEAIQVQASNDIEKMVKVGNYFVEQKYLSTMEAIMKKYGDIAKDCRNSSTMFRSSLVQGVCEVIEGLKVPLEYLNHDRFNKHVCFVKEAVEMGLSVKWLEQRLSEVSKAIEWLKEYNQIKDAETQNLGKIDYLKGDIGLMEIEKRKCEKEIESLKCLVDARKKKSAINEVKDRCKNVPKRLLDGLY